MHMYLQKKLTFFKTFKYFLIIIILENGLHGARPLQRTLATCASFLAKGCPLGPSNWHWYLTQTRHLFSLSKGTFHISLSGFTKITSISFAHFYNNIFHSFEKKCYTFSNNQLHKLTFQFHIWVKYILVKQVVFTYF
jgi:hypothetical protein